MMRRPIRAMLRPLGLEIHRIGYYAPIPLAAPASPSVHPAAQPDALGVPAPAPNSAPMPLDQPLPAPQPVTPHVERASFLGALLHARSLGFMPSTIIDVGAANGTPELMQAFPESHHVLIEPLEEFEADLAYTVSTVSSAEYIIAAASGTAGTLTLNVHPDLYGSSLYHEHEDSDVNGVPRTIPALTIDRLVEEKQFTGPILLKIDVQGAELDVLAGAAHSLDRIEYLVLETTTFSIYDNATTFSDVIRYLDERGFVVYEIFEPKYRPLDGAMHQIDVAFVQRKGRFRREHAYATRAQREAQDKAFADVIAGVRARAAAHNRQAKRERAIRQARATAANEAAAPAVSAHSSARFADVPRILVLSETCISSAHGTGTLFLRAMHGVPAEKCFNICMDVQGTPAYPHLVVEVGEHEDAATGRVEYPITVDIAHVLRERGFVPDLLYAMCFSARGLKLMAHIQACYGGRIETIAHFLDFAPRMFRPGQIMPVLRETLANTAEVWTFTPAIGAYIASVIGRPLEQVVSFCDKPPPAPPRQYRPFSPGFRAVIIGNVWYSDLLLALGQVWARLQARLPGLQPIQWYCHPDMYEGCEKLLQSYGLALPDQVEYAGFVRDEALWAALKGADLAIIPFNATELPNNDYARFSFPSRLSELTAAALPTFLVGGRQTFTGEFILNHGIGTACSPEHEAEMEAMLYTLITNAGQRARYGERARALAEAQFDRDTVQGFLLTRFAIRRDAAAARRASALVDALDDPAVRAHLLSHPAAASLFVQPAPAEPDSASEASAPTPEAHPASDASAPAPEPDPASDASAPTPEPDPASDASAHLGQILEQAAHALERLNARLDQAPLPPPTPPAHVPSTARLISTWARHHFFGQNGEDFLLWQILRDEAPGLCVDVGAFDGLYLSNTHAFAGLGWRVICVEPQPAFAALCRVHQPASIVVEAVCTKTDAGQVTFTQDASGVFSAQQLQPDMLPMLQDYYASLARPFTLTLTQIATRTLDSILDEHAGGHEPLFISIDVEGGEIDVLAGLDLKRWSPRFLIIEANTHADETAVVAALEPCGYRLARRLFVNLVFVRDEADLDRVRAVDMRGFGAWQAAAPIAPHPGGPVFTQAHFEIKDSHPLPIRAGWFDGDTPPQHTADDRSDVTDTDVTYTDLTYTLTSEAAPLAAIFAAALPLLVPGGSLHVVCTVPIGVYWLERLLEKAGFTLIVHHLYETTAPAAAQPLFRVQAVR
jgi:FkbM family methyltransferase